MHRFALVVFVALFVHTFSSELHTFSFEQHDAENSVVNLDGESQQEEETTFVDDANKEGAAEMEKAGSSRRRMNSKKERMKKFCAHAIKKCPNVSVTITDINTIKEAGRRRRRTRSSRRRISKKEKKKKRMKRLCARAIKKCPNVSVTIKKANNNKSTHVFKKHVFKKATKKVAKKAKKAGKKANKAAKKANKAGKKADKAAKKADKAAKKANNNKSTHVTKKAKKAAKKAAKKVEKCSSPGFKGVFWNNIQGQSLRNVGMAIRKVSKRSPGKVRTVKHINYPTYRRYWRGIGRFRGNWVARFSGYLQVPRTGYYSFWTVSDDGSWLMVDGKRVVNNDGIHGMRRAGGRKKLSKGSHKITIWFFRSRSRSGAGLNVQWKGPGFGRQVITSSKVCSVEQIIPKPK